MSKTFHALKKLQQDGLFASDATKGMGPEGAATPEHQVSPGDAHDNPAIDSDQYAESTPPQDAVTAPNLSPHDPHVDSDSLYDQHDGPSHAAAHDPTQNPLAEPPNDSTDDYSMTLPIEQLPAKDLSDNCSATIPLEGLLPIDDHPPAVDEAPEAEPACEATADGPAQDVPSGFDLLVNTSPALGPELADEVAELEALADLAKPPHATADFLAETLQLDDAPLVLPAGDVALDELVPDEAWQELEALAAAKSLEAEFHEVRQQSTTAPPETDIGPPPAVNDSADATLHLPDDSLFNHPEHWADPEPPPSVAAGADYDPVIPSVDDLMDDFADDELATLPFFGIPRGESFEESAARLDEPHDTPVVDRRHAEPLGAEQPPQVAENAVNASEAADRARSDNHETTVDWVPQSTGASDNPSNVAPSDVTIPLEAIGLTADDIDAQAGLSGNAHPEPSEAHPDVDSVAEVSVEALSEITDGTAHSIGESVENSALGNLVSQWILLPGCSEALQQCMRRIEEQVEKRQPHVLLLASAIETTRTADVLCLLAYYLRESGRKVLLIDANLSRQHMTRALGALGEPGLCDVLAGCHKATDVVRSTGINGVSFVPCGDDVVGVSRNADLFSESAWVQALHRWENDFSQLLIDAGAGDSTLLPTLARNSQAAALVVPYETRDTGLLRTTARNLDSLAPLTLGCLLTDFPRMPA